MHKSKFTKRSVISYLFQVIAVCMLIVRQILIKDTTGFVVQYGLPIVALCFACISIFLYITPKNDKKDK